jgi:hypothetical protein
MVDIFLEQGGFLAARRKVGPCVGGAERKEADNVLFLLAAFALISTSFFNRCLLHRIIELELLLALSF